MPPYFIIIANLLLVATFVADRLHTTASGFSEAQASAIARSAWLTFAKGFRHGTSIIPGLPSAA